MIKKRLTFLIIFISFAFFIQLSCTEHRDLISFPDPALKKLMSNQWNLQSYGEIGNEQLVLEGTEIYIQFGEEDECWGSAGCNAYTARYIAATDNLIDINYLYSTEKFCQTPDGIMEQEEYYLDALPRVTTFEVGSNQLQLFYNEKRSVLSYIAN